MQKATDSIVINYQKSKYIKRWQTSCKRSTSWFKYKNRSIAASI